MAQRKNIVFGNSARRSGKVGPITDAEREANRLRLEAIMAQGKPAIEAPPGVFVLQEAGIEAWQT